VRVDQNSQSWNWVKECSFSSNMTTAHTLIDEVMEKVRAESWNSKDLFATNLALEEAFANAVEHGNESDPGKQVHFLCKLSGTKIYVRIEDEGPGFNPNTLPDPTDIENLMSVSGRGVLLIKSFVSHAQWNEKGNVLEFEKDRSNT
jgi:serine/threonine-protein kinase RsbW